MKPTHKQQVSNRQWKAQALEKAAQCEAWQKDAERRALSPDLTAEERADAWSEESAYGKMARDWERTARGRDDWRDIQEAKGSAEGIEKRKSGSTFVTGNFLDELRQIHNPKESAEWHRRKLDKEGHNPPGLRAMQRALKKIRG